MLVVSRKKDESMIIDDVITVTVVEIRGDKVRLGIECPAEIPVHRREVWEAIRRYDPPAPRPAPPAPAAPPPPAPVVVAPPATSSGLRPAPSTSAPPSVDAAIDVLLQASARLAPEEAAAARTLLEAARRRLG